MNLVNAGDEEFIRVLNGFILANLENENFGAKELIQLSGLNRTVLNRRLHSITRKYINQYIREVRLGKALEMLQNETLTASEVAYKVGFSTSTYFNKCFHDYFGFPPGKVKKGHPDIPVKSDSEIAEGTTSRNFLMLNWRRIVIPVLLTVTVVIILFVKFQKTFESDDLLSPDGRISMAVMPFQNMTRDTTWDIWQVGIQTNLISLLSNSADLKVRQVENINHLLQSYGITNYASLSPSVAGSMSRKLDASVFIYGNILNAGPSVRVIARLFKTGSEGHLRSFQIDGTPGEIMKIIDTLSVWINNYLEISKLKKAGQSPFPDQFVSSTNSPEAYKCFIYGQNAYYKNDYNTARSWFLQALAIDSNLVGALAKISTSYYNEFLYDQGKIWFRKYYGKLGTMDIQHKIWANLLHTIYFETPFDRIRYLRQLIDMDDHQPITYFQLGDSYLEMDLYEKAIPEFQKALNIFHRWRIKPSWVAYYIELGQAYHHSGKYREEKKLYRKAEKDFPGDPELLDQQAWLALTLGDTAAANRYMEKYITVRKEQLWSEAKIAGSLAYIYSMADIPEKTEEYYRQALSLEPQSPLRMTALAYFLIDKERNVKEGLELSEKVLKINPDHYYCLHAKGWGLYKTGKFKEAVEILQKSMESSPIYRHTIFKHLEEAKKAAASEI